MTDKINKILDNSIVKLEFLKKDLNKIKIELEDLIRKSSEEELKNEKSD
jgi:hypothetical protein